MYKKNKRKKHTHTTVQQCLLISSMLQYYYAENIYLFNVTLAEFYRHDCRISESSLTTSINQSICLPRNAINTGPDTKGGCNLR